MISTSGLDGLSKIANALDRYGKDQNSLRLLEREYLSIEFDEFPLMWDLKLALEHRLRFTDIGETTLLDFVLNELLFCDRGEIANELRRRIDDALAAIKGWEFEWRHVVKSFGEYVAKYKEENPGYVACGADYLGRLTDEMCYSASEQLDDICGSVAETATWIRHFVNTQKRKTAQAGTPANTPALAEFSPQIDARQLVALLEENKQAIPKATQEAARRKAIGRWKTKLGYKPQDGNIQKFQLSLSRLRDCGIKYPDSWDTSPT